MRAGSADPETLICSDLRKWFCAGWIRPGKLLKYRGKYRSHFHDGLVHFGFDFVADNFLSLHHYFLFMAPELPGLG